MEHRSQASPEHPPPRRRRWFRRSLWTLLTLALLYFLLTESFVARRIVMWQVGSLVGGKATASRVKISPFAGRLVIEDAVVRAQGIRGDGGVVFKAERLTADLRWLSLLGANPDIRRIELLGPVFRVSQSLDDGRMNFQALRPGPSAGGSKFGGLPALVVIEGAIELGEHETIPDRGDPVYRALHAFGVTGEVANVPGSGGSEISFRQSSQTPGRGMGVTGLLNDEGLRLTLVGEPIEAWSPEKIPGGWRGAYSQLDLKGSVTRAELWYPFGKPPTATITVASVGVNLPVTVQPGEDADGNIIPVPPGEENRRLRLDQTDGVITLRDGGLKATLRGLCEELPYDVEFEYRGTTADAPFTCKLTTRNFDLRERPMIVRFAPGVARRRLEQFGDPTATVDLSVLVERGEPVNGGPGAIRVSGDLTFRDGSAAFERFPYRFYQLSGEASFSDEEILIKRVEGVARDGARIHASGRIWPPTEESEVVINVTVKDLTVGEELAAALGQRARIVEELFSFERHAELVEKGLVTTAAKSAEAKRLLQEAAAGRVSLDDAALAALREEAARPVFEPGGICDVDVRVIREPGKDARWLDTEVIRFREARLLPATFPYPIIASGIIVEKTNADATVDGGEYRGLTGGTATLGAYCDFSKLDNPDTPFVPEIQVTAFDVPIDRFFLNAIPRQEGVAHIGDRLAALNPTGTAGVQAWLGLNQQGESVYEVRIRPANATITPPASGERAVALRDIKGEITAVDEGVTVGLTGTAFDPLPHAVDDAASPIRLDARIEYAAGAERVAPDGSPTLDPAPVPPPRVQLRANAASWSAQWPVEDLVRHFSPQAAAKLETLRAEHEPSGRTDVRAFIEAPSGGEPVTEVFIENANALQVVYNGDRVSLTTTAGSAGVFVDAAAATTFDLRGLAARLRVNDADEGEILADGRFSGTGGPAGDGRPLNITLKSGRFESPLVQALINRYAPKTISELHEQTAPSGQFDLTLRLVPDGTTAEGSTDWVVSGDFSPRNILATVSGQPVQVLDASGLIRFEKTGGRIENLVLTAPTWEARADGLWIVRPDGGTSVQTTASLYAMGLTPDLWALLPPEISEVFGQLSLDIDGDLSVEGAQVSRASAGDGSPASIKATGQVRLSGASLEVGTSIDRASGVIDFGFERPLPGTPRTLEVRAMLDRFRVSGVSMSDGRVRVVGGGEGEFFVPLISADCYGGRMTGTASLFPTDGAGRSYEASLQLSDVRFASVLSELTRTNAAAEEQTADAAPDGSRGLMYASVTFGGVMGDLASRRGSGKATIAEGRVLSIPLVVPLVRLSSLQLPFDETLDFASADFYLRDRTMSFEEISISSRSVQIVGFGTIDTQTQDIDLRVRTRARSRVPVISDITESVRDELVSAVVKGKLREPELSMQTLTGTTRFIGRLLGRTPSEQQQKLDDLERRLGTAGSRTPPRTTVGGAESPGP